VVAFVVYFCFVLLLIFRCVHSAVTPGESRFRLHCNGALVVGINTKLRRDINSPDFYRATHFSAKRGIAIACRLSVCLSVRLSVRPSV